MASKATYLGLEVN